MSVSLVEAVRAGDRRRVQAALKSGADPNEGDTKSTPLGHAASVGDRSICKLVLQAGADPAVVDADGFFPLALAAAHDHGPTVALLLDRGAPLEQRDRKGGTALHVAASHGATKSTRALLAAGAALDAEDEYATQPLAYAAMHGRVPVVKMLLKAGADVQAVDSGGQSALLHALWKMAALRVERWELDGLRGDEPVVFVIRHGALRVREGDREIEPPVAAQRDIAAQCNPDHETYLACADCAHGLVRAGANVQIADPQGRTPLHFAMEVGEPALAGRLLRSGAQLDAVDAQGRTPVHAAAGSGRPDLFERCKPLATADLSAADGEGLTPVHYAARAGQIDVLRWLLYRREVSVLLTPRPSDLAREAEQAAATELLCAREEHQEKMRSVPRPRLLSEVIEALKAGTHYLPYLGRARSWRGDLSHVNAVVNGRWFDGWVDAEGTLALERSVVGVDELVVRLQGLAEGDKVEAALLDWSTLPAGTKEAIRRAVEASD